MPTPNAPDALTPSQVDRDRFHRDYARLPMAARSRPTLVAVSGGADSLALLLLMRAELGALCHAATVDHGLRPEAPGEAAMVAAVCARLGVSHAVLRGVLPQRAGGTANLSQRARVLRYALLERHREAIGAGCIATAHHADDQLETMVMRLNRGSGAAGLAGIRASHGRVMRPLLTWRRHDLRRIVAAAGLVPVDDPSNRDDRFDRARLRKALAGADWIDPIGVAHSADHLAATDEALDWALEEAADRYSSFEPGLATLTDFFMPAEARRRFVLRCIRHIDAGARPRGDALDRVIAALEREDSVTIAGVLCDVEILPLPGSGRRLLWRFRPAPPRRPVSR